MKGLIALLTVVLIVLVAITFGGKKSGEEKVAAKKVNSSSQSKRLVTTEESVETAQSVTAEENATPSDYSMAQAPLPHPEDKSVVTATKIIELTIGGEKSDLSRGSVRQLPMPSGSAAVITVGSNTKGVGGNSTAKHSPLSKSLTGSKVPAQAEVIGVTDGYSVTSLGGGTGSTGSGGGSIVIAGGYGAGGAVNAAPGAQKSATITGAATGNGATDGGTAGGGTAGGGTAGGGTTGGGTTGGGTAGGGAGGGGTAGGGASDGGTPAVAKNPPGTYEVFNNLIFHNYSPDYGGGITMYEVKDHLKIYGNMIVENKADDHGGGAFFEDTGPIDLYGNVFLRNFCADDGGAVSFEDVGDRRAVVNIYENLFAENIADDRSENSARGGAISFDDTINVKIYRNTIVGNTVTGSNFPAGGGIDSERHGHEYVGVPPGFSDPEITDNIIWNNWRINYSKNNMTGEDDLDYTWGTNFRWELDQLHVDNPAVQSDIESHMNSETFSKVEGNVLAGGEYAGRAGNRDLDPLFVNPNGLDWNLSPQSPLLANEDGSPSVFSRIPRFPPVPDGIMGSVWMPTPYVD